MPGQLRKARRESKHWWRLTNQIANRSGGQRGIPALKLGNEWVLDRKEKANLFADVFRAKTSHRRALRTNTKRSVLHGMWLCLSAFAARVMGLTSMGFGRRHLIGRYLHANTAGILLRIGDSHLQFRRRILVLIANTFPFPSCNGRFFIE